MREEAGRGEAKASPPPPRRRRRRKMLTCRMIEREAVVEDVLRAHSVGVVTEGGDAVIPAGRQRVR